MCPRIEFSRSPCFPLRVSGVFRSYRSFPFCNSVSSTSAQYERSDRATRGEADIKNTITPAQSKCRLEYPTLVFSQLAKFLDARNARGSHLRLARMYKCVTNMVRHHDQDERETDGARHWMVYSERKFRNQLEKKFTDEDWLHCLYLGSIKTRFWVCKDENGELRYIRAIQRH